MDLNFRNHDGIQHFIKKGYMLQDRNEKDYYAPNYCLIRSDYNHFAPVVDSQGYDTGADPSRDYGSRYPQKVGFSTVFTQPYTHDLEDIMESDANYAEGIRIDYYTGTLTFYEIGYFNDGSKGREVPLYEYEWSNIDSDWYGAETFNAETFEAEGKRNSIKTVNQRGITLVKGKLHTMEEGGEYGKAPTTIKFELPLSEFIRRLQGSSMVNYTGYLTKEYDAETQEYEDYNDTLYIMTIVTKTDGRIKIKEWETQDMNLKLFEKRVIKEFKELVHEADGNYADDLVSATLERESYLDYTKDKSPKSSKTIARYIHFDDDVMSRDEPHGFEVFNVEFNEWADQELMSHGKDISFKDWAEDEGMKHGNTEITDWAQHEEESHDARYGAESFEAEDGDDCPSCANACKHDDSNKIKVESIYDYEVQSPSNMVIQVTCLDCGESGTFYADEVDWHGEEAKLRYSPQIAVNMMNPTYGDLRCSRCLERFQMAAEYKKTDDERILAIHKENGKRVGTVSIETLDGGYAGNDDVYISIDGYNEEGEHGSHPMIWDGIIPQSGNYRAEYDIQMNAEWERSWLVKSYPHTITKQQHDEIIKLLDEHDPKANIYYVRYGDTMRIITPHGPLKASFLPTFSAESDAQEKYQEFLDEWDGDDDPPSFEEWEKQLEEYDRLLQEYEGTEEYERAMQEMEYMAETFSKDKVVCIKCGIPSGFPHPLHELPQQVAGKYKYTCRNCYDEVRSDYFGAESSGQWEIGEQLEEAQMNAEGGGRIDHEGGRMVSIDEVITVDYTWRTDPDDAEVDDYTVNQEVEGKIEREMHEGDSGYGYAYAYDDEMNTVDVSYNWDKTIEEGGEEIIKSWAETDESFEAERKKRSGLLSEPHEGTSLDSGDWKGIVVGFGIGLLGLFGYSKLRK